MRVLVLSSLAVQFLLFIFSFMRRFNIHGVFGFIMWLAYLAGDLRPRHALQPPQGSRSWSQQQGLDQDHEGRRSGSSLLEVVWAPILLIHLGGHDGITAYNIEDNELWSRHLVTAVSQRLLAAAIVLFISGVIKCFTKPWALKRASHYRIQALCPERTAKQNEGERCQIQEYVQQTKAFVREHEAEGHHPPSRRGDEILHRAACKLFVDLPSPYPDRLSIIEYFWVLSKEEAFLSVRDGLASAFLLLYTREKSVGPLGEYSYFSRNLEASFLQWVLLLRTTLPWAAIGLFHKSHGETYIDTDVKITYAIFCCTAILETYSVFPTVNSFDQWPTIAQYNLTGYFVRNKKHSKIMRAVSFFGCKGLLDQSWCMRSCFSSRRITELVLQYLKAGWKGRIQDAASYRRFNDSRGHWALKGNQDLGWSIKGPFDESVLLWHIATDFCFFSRSVSEHKSCKAVLCRQMSNYMMYLLFVNPEMLLPGTRRNLFTAAYKELNKILDDGNPSQRNPPSQSQQKPAPVKEKELIKRLITTMGDKTREPSEEGSNGGSKGSFIDDAWTLAQGLLKLNDDEMWEVIKSVWVEMLCFSASRCRGYLHAKALSSGGEFLSYVWLLMSYMGMETITDRLQREELPTPSRQEETNSADPLASYASNGTAPSTPKIHNSAAPSASEVHINMALVEDISTCS
ncbi:hypothetical protein HU200_020537 [Digitaria exilis]|uniref:DUF4220 domain-containing protein n=1 Tax=Digitaria exilis TaxID=1010633 RepID=A0A835KFZ8_9POAL|nr:hypothetical protein HU200_020537 [Digitaria exilis]